MNNPDQMLGRDQAEMLAVLTEAQRGPFWVWLSYSLTEQAERLALADVPVDLGGILEREQNFGRVKALRGVLSMVRDKTEQLTQEVNEDGNT